MTILSILIKRTFFFLAFTANHKILDTGFFSCQRLISSVEKQEEEEEEEEEEEQQQQQQ